jgi:hypothetical protein
MWAGMTDHIHPSYDWQTPDSLAFAEVLSVGSGDLWGPGRESPVNVGDIVCFEQLQAAHDFAVECESGDYEHRVVVPFKALMAKCSTGMFRAVGHWIAVEPAQQAVAAILRPTSTLHLPGDNACVQNTRGPTNLSFGRVSSVGDGVEVKGGLSRPDCDSGDLIGFFDVMTSTWRGKGRVTRFVPWSEAVIGLE